MLKFREKMVGFTLPTVIITSVVMLALLVLSMQLVSQSSTSLRAQYHFQLAREAAEAGLATAKECPEGWTNTLRSGSSCSGASTQCHGAGCFVAEASSVRTRFEVAPATVHSDGSRTIISKGITEMVRPDGTYFELTSHTSKMQHGGALSGGSESSGKWKSVSAGHERTCAVSMADQVYCWGRSRLGNNTTSNSSLPVPIHTAGALADNPIKSVDVGYQAGCVIANDDWGYCWGSTGVVANAPIALNPLNFSSNTFKYISSGIWRHSCGVSSNNRLYCWGDGSFGGLGVPPSPQSSTDRPRIINPGAMPAGEITDISVGGGFACTVGGSSQKKAYCWGVGALGVGSTPNTHLPMAVSVPSAIRYSNILSIKAGWSNACLLADNGRVYCWGSDVDMLGNNASSASTVPVQTTIGHTVYSPDLIGQTFKSVSINDDHVCAIASNDQGYCWGSNQQGQLGVGEISYMGIKLNPTRLGVPGTVNRSGVLSGRTLKSISAGSNHTCALADDDEIYCWGNNEVGQLGNGTTTSSSVKNLPVKVQSDSVQAPISDPAPTIIY